MIVPTIDAVCTSAAAAIASISGVRAKGWADEKINEPEVHVFTREFDPRMVFGATKHPLPVTARLFAKATDSRSAQLSLRGFMEPTSVLDKIEEIADWTGDGSAVDYAEVTLITSPSQIEIAGTVRWYVDFEFDVCF